MAQTQDKSCEVTLGSFVGLARATLQPSRIETARHPLKHLDQTIEHSPFDLEDGLSHFAKTDKGSDYLGDMR
jgi:hypothetical protein